MKVLHVSARDKAGGRFAGFQMLLHPPSGCEVSMAVQSRTVNEPRVFQLPPGSAVVRSALNTMDRLLERAGLDGALGISGMMLKDEPYFQQADVVHYHLLHARSQVSVLSLPSLTRLKPSVWTLHDMWPLTGGCEYSVECEAWKSGCGVRCPHPRRKALLSHTNPRVHWALKRRAYRNSRLTFVVASKWMESRALQSPLVRGCEVERIPFGVDTGLFRADRRVLARDALGIQKEAFVVAFRNSGVPGDRYKGLREIQKALRILTGRASLTVIVIGDKKGFEFVERAFPTVFTGWVDDDALADALAASDLFLMPSFQEAFGLMAVEAMASGAVPIVYSGTSLPEITDAPRAGVCVEQGRHDLLAEAVVHLSAAPQELATRRQNALECVSRLYRLETYLEKHRLLYERVVRERGESDAP